MSVLSAVLPILVGHCPARADGMVVKKKLNLDELARTSDAIFTATLIDNDTQWDSIEANGARQRFVQEYRFRIKVTGWLKGKPTTPDKGVPWLICPGDPIPGAWTIVNEHFDSSFELQAAKPGDKVVVFALASDIQGWGTTLQDGRAVLHARAVEAAALLPAVKAALASRSGKGAQRSRSAR